MKKKYLGIFFLCLLLIIFLFYQNQIKKSEIIIVGCGEKTSKKISLHSSKLYLLGVGESIKKHVELIYICPFEGKKCDHSGFIKKEFYLSLDDTKNVSLKERLVSFKNCQKQR